MEAENVAIATRAPNVGVTPVSAEDEPKRLSFHDLQIWKAIVA